MKTLNECKEYYKDVYTDHLTDKENVAETKRYEMHRETLKFIYGEEFTKVESEWQNEALSEMYSEFNHYMD